MASNYWQSGDEGEGEGRQDVERRVVLIGITGSGKSSTANTIIGRTAFKPGVSGSSVTKKCQRVQADINGYKLSVVDTPGLFDTGMTNQEVTIEIAKCIQMLCPGPHAFILVIKIDRFTAEVQKTVQHFVENFGEEMFRHMLVIFTRKDDIDRQGVDIETFITNIPQPLKEVLQKCENRFLALDNTADTITKKQDVQDLFKLIDGILVNNNGHCYTNELFQEAERELKLRVEREKTEIQRKKQEELDKHTEVIRREMQFDSDRELAEKLYHEEVWVSEETERLFRETELMEIQEKIQTVQCKMGSRSRQYSSARLQRELDGLQSELDRMRRKHRQMDEEAQLNTEPWKGQDIYRRY